MRLVLTILDEEIVLESAPEEERRLRDLAAALEARIRALGAEKATSQSLSIIALSLMDEVQAARAALARAHGEIERLNDMVVEARLASGEPSDKPSEQAPA